jgi:hypothetical protein
MSVAITLPKLDISGYLIAKDPYNMYQPNPGLYGVPIRKDWGVKDRPLLKVVDGDNLVGYIMKADVDALPTPESIERAVNAMEALLARTRKTQ